MSKKILLAGASGLVGGHILNILDDGNSELTLLLRNKLQEKKHLKQVVTDFDNFNQLNEEDEINEVYIAIGKKLSLFDLIYLKKEKRKDFKKVDFDYIKNIAIYAKKLGAKSIGLISAIGANDKSRNVYLNTKERIEKEIIAMGFEKVVIARPSHLLGKRKNEQISFLISVFENITNVLGYLMIGPLKKYRNVYASNVASSLVSKMNNADSGIHILDFNNFKN
tara:strand:- start:1344 stop:2012 length:669 start_codon:yes stop_codon:yes gene_type:complete